MFSAIGGFVGRLFGSEKAIEKGMDVLVNAGDKIFYTKEEQADDARISQESKQAYLLHCSQVMLDWMKNSQGQNLSRRVLALSIGGVWLGQYVFSGILDFIAIWITDPDTSTKLIASVAMMDHRAETMNGAMMIILPFYFAAPYMKSFIPAAVSKLTGKPMKEVKGDMS